MLSLSTFLAFTAAASIFAMTPGLDTVLVLRTAAISGRAALAASLGVCSGCLVWGLAVSVGLGSVLQASPLAYAALKWAGAAYLLWLGIGMLLRPRRSLAADDVALGPNTTASLRRGLLTNLLNPKVGLFYVTFLPQFIPTHANVALCSMLLTLIHVTLGLAWFCILLAAFVPLGRFLRRPATIAVLDRLTGGLFIAFGVRLVASQG